MKEEIVEKINEHTNAINKLSKRINNKIDGDELRLLFDELSNEIEKYKQEIAMLTKGLVDFFTESLLKNTEANDLIREAVKMNTVLMKSLNVVLDDLNDKKIEWLT